MNPYGIRGPRLDLAAWRTYDAENAAARLEYRRHPIVTTAVCEVCGHTSATALCPTCKENDQ